MIDQQSDKRCAYEGIWSRLRLDHLADLLTGAFDTECWRAGVHLCDAFDDSVRQRDLRFYELQEDRVGVPPVDEFPADGAFLARLGIENTLCARRAESMACTPNVSCDS